ncbi:MAG: hypothetical protein ACHQHO_02570 [Solirubrobacterales bacterium]
MGNRARYVGPGLGRGVLNTFPDGSASGVPAAQIYISGRDLTGEQPNEATLTARLARLSAGDCLLWIAHLQTRLFSQARPQDASDLQRRLVEEVLGGTDTGTVVLRQLALMPDRSVFCEQQLVHLARLVIAHADRRPRDEFAQGELAEDWARCLLEVNDLLDAELDPRDDEQLLSWEIRQCSLNHHEDELPVNAIHHEVYRVLWPARQDKRSRDAEEAFRRHTGMTVGEYFTIGAATVARLAVRGADQPTLIPAIKPAEYFSHSELSEQTWRAFFAFAALDLDGLAAELIAEEQMFAATTYASLTFERFPLAEIEPGLFAPISMRSLQRKITQGVFHALSEAAEADGHDRRRYVNPFGNVFQQSVEQTLRRGVGFCPENISITADVPYGTRTRSRDSTDVILGYERNPVFVEVVSGPLQAATITRGDLCTFASDSKRLVVKKAEQLDQNIHAFFAAELQLSGVDPAIVAHAWPVIVTSHPFPHRERIIDAVLSCVRREGHLTDERIGGLSIVSAEELFFCEGFMQQGKSFLALIRGWKSGPHPDISFKNYLIELGGGRAPSSTHFEKRYAQFHAEIIARIAGQSAPTANS